MDCNIIQSPLIFELGDELLPLPSLSGVNIAVPPNDIIVSQNPKYGRRRKAPPLFSSEGCPNENKKKRIIHRDLERQRRQEMSTLYAALRALLPPEYLRGKRSICDHMHETVKYIQHMQKKIQELSQKRDELKRHVKENLDQEKMETPTAAKKESVVVMKKHGGFRVVLNTTATHKLQTSSILQVLVAERLEITSCISTKINDRFVHIIESKAVDNNTSVDLSELEHKLTNLEYFRLD